jgi:hypothetical protein
MDAQIYRLAADTPHSPQLSTLVASFGFPRFSPFPFLPTRDLENSLNRLVREGRFGWHVIRHVFTRSTVGVNYVPDIGANHHTVENQLTI